MSQALLCLTALALHKGIASVLLFIAQRQAKFSFLTATLPGEVGKLAVSLLAFHLDPKSRNVSQEYSLLSNEEEGKTEVPGPIFIKIDGQERITKDLKEQQLPANVKNWTQSWHRKSLILFGVASAYVVQNNLYLYASVLLRPTVLQVIWQVRILMTAAASALLLKRSFSQQQVLGLCGLLFSVLCLQKGLEEDRNLKENEQDIAFVDSTVGVLCALAASIISGFAGVFTELVLKDESTNIWTANIQMSFYSLIPAAILVLLEVAMMDSSATHATGLIGFDSLWAWMTVFIHGVAGLLVAFATKYASSVSKSFSGAFGILITFIISVIFGIRPQGVPSDIRMYFLIAGNLVLYYSTWLYAFNG